MIIKTNVIVRLNVPNLNSIDCELQIQISYLLLSVSFEVLYNYYMYSYKFQKNK